MWCARTKMVGDVLHFPNIFNSSGSLFTHCASSGKLKIWDTGTGVLKQEFTRSGHLGSICSCLLWIQVSKHGGHKRKKLKSAQSISDCLDIIALGTNLGSIILYDAATNSVKAELEEHLGKVNDLTWSNSQSSLYSCSDDRHIIEWDLSSHKVKSKWKLGKENVYCILALVNGKHLLSASYSIKLWDLEKKQVIKVFVGHGTEVTSLIELPGRDGYFVSAAKGDRLLSVWSLSCNEKKSNQVASLILQNPAVSIQMVNSETDTPTTLFAVTEEGTLQVFKHKFNGNMSKPLKPVTTLSLASGNSASKHSNPIAVQGVCPLENDKLLLAYGSTAFPSFEIIGLGEIDEENVVLVRQDKRKNIVADFGNKCKTPVSNDEVEYQVPGSAMKRGSKRTVEVPLEERLENLALVNLQSMDAPKKDNMAQLLLQGLQSRDKTILQNVFFRAEPSAIDVTVRHLPVQALVPLIRELTFLVQGKTFASKSVVEWLQSIVRIHSGILLSNPELADVFEPLLSSIEAKVAVLTPLLKLKGRLALITEQMGYNLDENVDNAVEPVYTYQEESSDDGDLDKMSEGSVTDSDDNWDEYSDMGEEMDDK